MSDYTLAELQQLHLLADGAPTPYRIPTLEDALDLVEEQSLALLSLQDFDLVTLAATLSARPSDHILVYNVDPVVLQEVVKETGLPAFISIRRSRVFDTSDNLGILNAHHELLGDTIVLAHINSTRLMTSDSVARTAELGIRLSVSGGREDFALEQGDPGPWQAALATEAAVFWTPNAEQVLELLRR